MKRFPGIDGLRAWLAMAVVASHLFLFTAINQHYPILGKLDNAAHQAVLIFMIVSGFVITHLLVERREPYRLFLARRLLRLYPVYLVCLIIGIFTTYLHLIAFANHPFGPFVPEADLLTHEIQGLTQHGVSLYLATHLSLLYGAIPNQWLAQSQYMFLGVAWSLSLEWQFYLLAPLALFLWKRTWGKFLVASLVTAGVYAYSDGHLGDFDALSFLPGASLYFVVGVGTRLIFDEIPQSSTYPSAALLLALAFIHMTQFLIPFFAWAGFIIWLTQSGPKHRKNPSVTGILDAAFLSKPMQRLGHLSFAIFLIHEPVMHALGYLCIVRFGLGMVATTAVTLLAAPPIILFAAHFLHQAVELPAIAYGRRLSQNQALALDKLHQIKGEIETIDTPLNQPAIVSGLANRRGQTAP